MEDFELTPDFGLEPTSISNADDEATVSAEAPGNETFTEPDFEWPGRERTEVPPTLIAGISDEGDDGTWGAGAAGAGAAGVAGKTAAHFAHLIFLPAAGSGRLYRAPHWVH